MTPSDWIGAIGVSLLLLAFALQVLGKLDGKGAPYAAINALGAGLAMIASLLIPFWPFVVLEGVWCAVSLAALMRAVRPSNLT